MGSIDLIIDFHETFFLSLIDVAIDLVIDFGSWLSAATFLAQTWGLPLLKGQSKALAHSCSCQKSSVSFFLSVALPKGQPILVERMAGKGGARHQPKPMVDEMLLVTAFKIPMASSKQWAGMRKSAAAKAQIPRGSWNAMSSFQTWWNWALVLKYTHQVSGGHSWKSSKRTLHWIQHNSMGAYGPIWKGGA